MSLEKPFIEGHIFDSHNMRITQFYDLIYQGKWETMWQGFLNVLLVVNRRLAWVVHRNAFSVLVLFDILFDLFGELYIGTVPGPVGNNSSLDRIAN